MPENFIAKMAGYLAEMERRADVYFYVNDDATMTTYYLDRVDSVKDICDLIGCTTEVWAEAKKIYDFTNSGKEGYMLRGGKIVKVEEE